VKTPDFQETQDRLESEISAYTDHLKARAFAGGTIRNTALYLGNFRTWLITQNVADLSLATRCHLESYQLALSQHIKRDGTLLSVAGQYVRLITIQGLFRWMARNRKIAADPSLGLELPRLSQRLPRFVLTAEQVELVISRAATHTSTGLRDRTIMEVLYSTGLRRSELCGLRLEDLDLHRCSLLVREGKGRKDRLLPLGKRAAHWVGRYLNHARPALLAGSSHAERTLFISVNGRALSSGVLGQLVHSYVKSANLIGSGSCHLFRHAMATLMLEGGADIRYIQHMLGHARLSTTEIYTRVNVSHLATVHTRSHPGERSFTTNGNRRCTLCGQNIPHPPLPTAQH